MDAPPVLTPERIDAMLSIMAEVCLEGVVDAGQRQKTADDPEAFERGGRTLQRACRNLRQTIAMKQRHDREQARKAEDGRKLATAERQQAQHARDGAVAHKQARVQRHFERLLWDEYEDDDAQERFEDLDERLDDLADEPDFLDTPTEILIQRLADEIGLGGEPADDPPEPPPPPPPRGRRDDPGVSANSQIPTQPPKNPLVPAQAGTQADPPPGPAVRTSAWVPAGAGTSGDGAGVGASAHQAQTPSGGTSAPDSDGPAAAPPSGPPPDPLPEPYVPPWEQLRPGQIMPGGTGW